MLLFTSVRGIINHGGMFYLCVDMVTHCPSHSTDPRADSGCLEVMITWALKTFQTPLIIMSWETTLTESYTHTVGFPPVWWCDDVRISMTYDMLYKTERHIMLDYRCGCDHVCILSQNPPCWHICFVFNSHIQVRTTKVHWIFPLMTHKVFHINSTSYFWQLWLFVTYWEKGFSLYLKNIQCDCL